MTSVTSTATAVNSTNSGSSVNRNAATNASHPTFDNRVLDKRRLQELVKEVDPLEQLDEDVEEVLFDSPDTLSYSLVRHNVLDI